MASRRKRLQAQAAYAAMAQSEVEETFDHLEWRPDIASFPAPRKSLYMATATNVIPSADGYAPAPDLAALSSALTSSDIARGGAAFLNKSGAPTTIVGSSTALYELAADGTWDDRTRSAGAYTLGDEDRWTFGQFGDLVVAHNIADAVQVFDMTSDTEFSAAGGSPPNARYGAPFASQYVLFNTTTSQAHAIASRINDIDNWDADGTEGSWEITFADGGPLNAGFEVGGGFWFGQADKWRRVTFVGDKAVIDQDVVAINQGVDVPLSFTPFRGVAFYVGGDGFYRFNPYAGGPENIGADRVDNYFTDEFSRAQRHLVSTSIDPKKKLWLMAFPSASAASGRPDRIMVHYWPTNRWAILELEIEHLMSVYSLGVTWDGLDNLYATLDDVDLAFDNPLFVGGARLAGAMSTDQKFATFEGANLAATLESGDYEFGGDRAAMIKKCTPLVDAAGPTDVSVRIGYRDFLGAAVTYAAAQACNSEGEAFPQRWARYPRVRTLIAAGADWKKDRGVRVVWTGAGKR